MRNISFHILLLGFCLVWTPFIQSDTRVTRSSPQGKAEILPECQPYTADILINIEDSTKINEDLFTKIKQHVLNLTNYLDIGQLKPGQVRIAVTTFGHEFHHPDFTRFSEDRKILTERINNLHSHFCGEPNMYESLRTSHYILKNFDKGGSSNHIKIYVYIGTAYNNGRNLRSLASKARSQGTYIFVEQTQFLNRMIRSHRGRITNINSIVNLNSRRRTVMNIDDNIGKRIQELIRKPCDVCRRSSADVLIAIEDRGFISYAQFKKVKDYTLKLVNSFDIGGGSGQVRVATFPFSHFVSTTTGVISIRGYTILSIADSIKRLRKSRYSREADAVSCIKKARRDLKRFTRRARKIFIYIGTGSNSGSMEALKKEVNYMKRQGVQVFVVQIGEPTQAQLAVLETIASSPKSRRITTLNDSQRIQDVLVYNCEECYAPTMDIAFVLHNHKDLDTDKFKNMMSFVKKSVEKYAIGLDDGKTRVAVVSYGNDRCATNCIGLSSSASRSTFDAELAKIERIPADSANTAKAIQYTMTHVYTMRPNATRVMVIFPFNAGPSEVKAASDAMDRGILTFAVGPKEMVEKLNKLSGDESRTIIWDFKGSLNSRARALGKNTCLAVVDPIKKRKEGDMDDITL